MIKYRNHDVLEYLGLRNTSQIKLPVTKLAGTLEVVHITSDNPDVDTVIFNTFREYRTIYPKMTYSESHENFGNGCMVSLNPTDLPCTSISPDTLEVQGLLTIAGASPYNRKSLNVPDTNYVITRLSIGDEFVCVEKEHQGVNVNVAVNDEHTFGVISWIGDGVLPRSIQTPIFRESPDFVSIKAFDRTDTWRHVMSSGARQRYPHQRLAYATCADEDVNMSQDGLVLKDMHCNWPGSVYYAYCFFGEEAARLGIDLF